MGDKLRQVETDFPGERDVWYNYDGLGKRRNKLFADPDDLHWYRWAGWSVLSEYDTTGASGWEIPAAAARVDVAGLAERGAGAAYAYRLHDHLGSVRGLLGASKAPLARYAYAPYGELNHGAGRPLHRGFTGHHWDAESGMYYAPFRYYMPGAGRWLSREPLGFLGGQNLYWYANNNPVMYIDPDGQFAFLIPLFGAAIGAAVGGFCGGWEGALAGAALGAFGGLGGAAASVAGASGALGFGMTAITAIPAGAGLGGTLSAMGDSRRGRAIRPGALYANMAYGGVGAALSSGIPQLIPMAPSIGTFASAHTDALLNTAAAGVGGCFN